MEKKHPKNLFKKEEKITSLKSIGNKSSLVSKNPTPHSNQFFKSNFPCPDDTPKSLHSGWLRNKEEENIEEKLEEKELEDMRLKIVKAPRPGGGNE